MVSTWLMGSLASHTHLLVNISTDTVDKRSKGLREISHCLMTVHTLQRKLLCIWIMTIWITSIIRRFIIINFSRQKNLKSLQNMNQESCLLSSSQQRKYQDFFRHQKSPVISLTELKCQENVSL